MPDQRNVPAIAGWILKNGAVTGLGIRPNATIGSEKTTVTSRDSPRSMSHRPAERRLPRVCLGF